MKGIILAGGTGSRLWPATKSVSKQLLPVYDKPMIYYPLATLMLAGIREILIITSNHDSESFKALLGNGENLGIKLSYVVQFKPNGLAEALILGSEFLGDDSCVMILGDNIFFGSGLGGSLKNTFPHKGCHIFCYEVPNPSDYGVLELNTNSEIVSIEEKPKSPKTNLAITGLYFFDQRGQEFAKAVEKSDRGELEIISVIEQYKEINELTFTKLTRGTAWLDTGNPGSLHDAATFVRVMEERTGLKIACLEEIAFNNEWLSKDQIQELISNQPKNDYWNYVSKVIQRSQD
jgi:glucose-1-phosphate thymidylyltransferase